MQLSAQAQEQEGGVGDTAAAPPPPLISVSRFMTDGPCQTGMLGLLVHAEKGLKKVSVFLKNSVVIQGVTYPLYIRV